MKFKEMLKIIKENNILIMKLVIADEVENQLEEEISDKVFEELCTTIYNTFLGCIETDIYYLVNEELTKRGLITT